MPTTGTVDERVVEMRIDHEKFESGAKKTISILESLDKGLKSLGDQHTDGFDNIGGALDKVTHKISFFGTVGDQVIRNLTNKAMELGGQLAHAVETLTTAQIAAGWSKYADKTQGVQTIMAATAKDWEDQGAQMEWVNEQLEKLNWFTDETSYNFLEMVNNIGKFTSNGVKLETAVTAMEGISTWAALSGANANEASRAMYNLSQALATGSVKLIDWKSIENANMATREFKETALETAVALGTLKKNADGSYKTLKNHDFTAEQFNTQLSDAWFTSDVLLQTLQLYGDFTDALNAVSVETGLTATEILQAVDAYKEGGKASEDFAKICDDLDVSVEQMLPHMEILADEGYELGYRAFKAAQEAKTFKEAVDATKDAVSTGWMNIFEMMFGNYLQAKELWTDFAETLYNIFAEPVNQLQDLVEVAFGGLFQKDPNPKLTARENLIELVDELEKAGFTWDDFERAFGDYDEAKLKQLKDDYGSLMLALQKGAVDADTFAKALNRLLGNHEDEKPEGTSRRVEKVGKDGKKIIETYQGIVEKNEEISEESKNIVDRLIEDAKKYTNTLEGTKSGSELFTEGLLNLVGVVEDFVNVVDEALQLLFGDNSNPEDPVPWTVVLGERLYYALEAFNEFAAGLRLIQDKDAGIDEIAERSQKLAAVLSVFLTIRDVIHTVASAIITFVRGVITAIRESGILTSIWNALVIIFSGIGAVIQPIIDYVSDLVAKWRELSNMTWVEWLTDKLALLGAYIELAAVKFREFMETKVAAKVLDVVTRLVGLFARMKEAFSERGFAGAFEVLQTSFNNFLQRHPRLLKAFNAIKTVLAVIGGAVMVVASAIAFVVRQIGRFASFIGSAFSEGGISNIFKELGASIRSFLKDNPLLLSVFNFLSNAIQTISSHAQAGLTAIQNWFGAFDLSKFTDLFTNFSFDNLIQTIGDFFKNITIDTTSIQTFFENLKTNIGIVFSRIDIFSTLREKIKGIGSQIREWFSSLKIGENFAEKLSWLLDILKSLFIGGAAFAVLKGSFSFGELIESLSDTMWKISLNLSVRLINSVGKALIKFALSVLMIAWALKIIAEIPEDRIGTALEVLTAIIARLLAVATGMALFTGIQVSGFTALISLAISVAILASVLKSLSGLSFSEMLKGWLGIKLIMDQIIKYTLTAGFFGNDTFWSLIGLATSVAMMAHTLSFLSTLSIGALLKGWYGLRLVLNQIIKYTLRAGYFGTGTFSSLVGLALSVSMVAHTLKFLSRFKIEQLLKGWFGLKLILDQIINYTIKAAFFAKGSFGSLLGLALAVELLAKNMWFLGKLSVGKILKGWLGLKLIIGQIIRFTKKVGDVKGKGLWQLIIIASSVAAFAIMMAELGKLPLSQIAVGWLAISGILYSIVKFSQSFKRINPKALAGLIGIAGIIAVLTAALLFLKDVPAAQLLVSAGTLSACFIAIVAAFAIINKSGSINRRSVGAMLAGVLALWGIAYTLSSLQDIQATQLLASAAALSLCILAISGTLVILGKAGSIKPSVIVALLASVGTIIGLSYAFRLLNNVDWKKTGKTVLLCMATLAAISGTLLLLGKVGKIKVSTIIALVVGIGALIGLSYAFTLLNEIDWEKTGKSVLICILTLVAVSLAVSMLGRIGVGGALQGILALGIIAGGIALIIWGLLALGSAMTGTAITLAKKLNEFMDEFKPFLDKVKTISDADLNGVKMLSRVMLNLAGAEFLSAITRFFNWAAGGGTYISDISSFVDALVGTDGLLPKLRTIKPIDLICVTLFKSVMASLAKAEMWETLATVVDKVGDWVTKGDSFIGDISTVAKTLSANLTYFESFNEGHEKNFTSFSAIMEALLAGTFYNVIGEGLDAIASKLTGGTSFVDNLAKLAEGIIKNLDTFTSFKPKDAKAIQSFADIMVEFAKLEALNVITTSLGAIAKLISGGEPFTKNLATIANGVKKNISKFSQFTPEDSQAIGNFTDIMLELAKVQAFETFTVTLQWLSETLGGGEDFIVKLAGIAETLKTNLQSFMGFSEGDATQVGYFAAIMQSIAGGTAWTELSEFISGLVDNDGFSADFLNLARDISTAMVYLRRLQDTDAAKVSTLSDILSEITGATLWSTVQDWIDDWDDDEDLLQMAIRLSTFASNLKPFLDVMGQTSPEALTNAETLAKTLDVFNRKAVLTDFSSEISAFYATLGNVDTNMVIEVLYAISYFVNSIGELNKVMTNSKSLSEDLGTLLSYFGTDLITNISTGIELGEFSLTESLTSTLTGAISTASASSYTEARGAGQMVGYGLAAGMYDSIWAVEAAARALANAAIVTTTGPEGFDEQSPSKVFQKIGAFLPAGLAKGVEDNLGTAEGSMTILASGVIAAMEMAMAKVATVADEGFEFNPTITPVVDLSNVSSAAGSVAGMFGGISPTMHGSVAANADRAQNTAATVSSSKGPTAVDEIQNLSDRIDSMVETMANLQIVLDSGELVGATSRKMDNAFGVMQMRRERGN